MSAVWQNGPLRSHLISRHVHKFRNIKFDIPARVLDGSGMNRARLMDGGGRFGQTKAAKCVTFDLSTLSGRSRSPAREIKGRPASRSVENERGMEFFFFSVVTDLRNDDNATNS